MLASSLADLRQSLGYNTMARELENPKLKDFLTIACYNNWELSG